MTEAGGRRWRGGHLAECPGEGHARHLTLVLVLPLQEVEQVPGVRPEREDTNDESGDHRGREAEFADREQVDLGDRSQGPLGEPQRQRKTAWPQEQACRFVC